jgi:hypothetical protein
MNAAKQILAGKPRSSSMIKMGSGKKIEYVIFDVDGAFNRKFESDRSMTTQLFTGLMIDSERVYTDVTSN